MVLTEGNKRPLDRLIEQCVTEGDYFDLFGRMIVKAAATRKKAELRKFATDKEFYYLEVLDYAIEKLMRTVEKKFDIDISADVEGPDINTAPGRESFEAWVKRHKAMKNDAEGK